jgi:RHS repeat-associated protein
MQEHHERVSPEEPYVSLRWHYTPMTTDDFLNRLSSISSAPSALSHTYSYNDANQRTRVNLADGSFWIYEYDKLGQVISGKRYWNDWTPVAGQQYEYAFDDIGNRTSTKAGGDSAGAGLRPAAYSANALNQYTTRDVPGAADVIGAAHPVASVTVNGQSPYRRGEYFWKELSINNTTAAIWQAVTNIAWLAGVSETNTGNLFLPKTAETYTYDADGNLTSDGRWTNKWDGENRLIEMTSHATGPSGSRKSLQFGYDSQSRRVSKVVSNWTGSAWTCGLHEKFAYDGWNLAGVLDGTNSSILKSFLWGLDLSGSLQGAGGVGGLIAFSNRQLSVGTHFAAYDGNGNVMALVDGGMGNISARHEYDSFGRVIRNSGPAATLNPMRFSSKHADDETDLAYYGYRYLNPNSGRWMNRDPLGSAGGANPYSFAVNAPQSHIDPRGLRLYVYKIDTWTLAQIQAQYGPGFLAVTTVTDDPKPIGSDDVREHKANNGCYCASVFGAKEIELIIHSYIPSDPPGPNYTESGKAALAAHEGRRLTVVEKGFAEYLTPSELKGSATTRCGQICTKNEGEAERLLRGYLSDLRVEAISQYWDYNLKEQGGITRELNSPQEGPLNEIINIHQIANPKKFVPPPCPKSDCPGC